MDRCKHCRHYIGEHAPQMWNRTYRKCETCGRRCGLPLADVVTLSPFVQRALANALPAKATR